MAHLHCEAHKRRTLVFKDHAGHTVQLHRSDGGDCNSVFQTINGERFHPMAHQGYTNEATALGPKILYGDFESAFRSPHKRGRKRTPEEITQMRNGEYAERMSRAQRRRLKLN